MKRRDYDSELEFLGALLAQHPYVPLSVIAHAALLALFYYFGSYQLQMQLREAEVASSLRATSMASTGRRLQDLETIKQLLEKSANRVEHQPAEPSLAPAPPETPEEMVERGRELSQAIDALDQEIRAEELAETQTRRTDIDNVVAIAGRADDFSRHVDGVHAHGVGKESGGIIHTTGEQLL